VALITAIIISIPVAGFAAAVDNSLDWTFGEDGIVTTFFPYPLEGENYATRVQADGKVVMVGSGGPVNSYFSVFRLNPDGTPDDSFGLNGSVRTTLNTGPAETGSMAIQPDGKIIATGYHTPGDFDVREYALVRYNPDGTRDSSFGEGGLIRGNTGYGSLINAATVLGDGKVLVAGTTDRRHNRMWLARFNPDGTLDQTFGGQGMAYLYYQSSCEGFTLAVQPDGKILIGGECSNYYFAIIRTDANGHPDTSFGSDGLLVTEFPAAAHINSLAIAEDGKIVAAGTIRTFPSKIALARYDAGGGLDDTFGTGGKAVHDNAAMGYSLLLRPGGKILVPGEVGQEAYLEEGPEKTFSLDGRPQGTPGGKRQQVEGDSEDAHFALLQFDSHGDLDASFGTGGIAKVSFGGKSDAALELALTPQGRIVAAGQFVGHTGDIPLKRLAAAQFSADGQIDPAFGTNGKVLVSPLTSVPELKDAEVVDGNKVLALGEINYQSNYDGVTTTHALMRYNPDGSIDGSFGIEGRTTFTSSGAYQDVAVLHDGSIVVGGHIGEGINRDLLLAKFTQDGQPDTAFGEGGYVTTAYGSYTRDTLGMLAVQSDDKIVAYVHILSEAGDPTPAWGAFVRYNPDGSLDEGFGIGGKAGARFAGATDALVIQPDGKLIVVGGSANSIAVSRYNPDGSTDTSFGNQGTAEARQGSFDSYGKALALGIDGKIVAVGFVEDAERSFEGRDGLAVRFNSNGTVDTTFGDQGGVRLNIADYFEWSEEVVVQFDGKPLIVHDPTRGPVSVVRLNTDGSLDTAFATGGLAMLPFSDIYELLTQQDGKVIAAGTRNEQFARGFGLARFVYGTQVPTPTPTQTSPPATATAPATHTASPQATATTTPGTAEQFSDVPASNPFYAYIACMASRDVISGYACGREGEPCDSDETPYFRPGNSMTRGQVSKIVANAAGYDDTPTGQTFQDVLPGSPFYDYVERMARRGIISGYPCGGPEEACVAPGNRPYFRPNANVSRGQLTKIVSNARGYAETPVAQTFEDVPTTDAFYAFVERLVARGVMSGYSCGEAGEPCHAPANRAYFRPGLPVTRGQASKIVGNSFFPNCQPAPSPE
jgi:uncharacterized delta-60 repeat protein